MLIGLFLAGVLKDFRWALWLSWPLWVWAIGIATKHLSAARLIRRFVLSIGCLAVGVALLDWISQKPIVEIKPNSLGLSITIEGFDRYGGTGDTSAPNYSLYYKAIGGRNELVLQPLSVMLTLRILNIGNTPINIKDYRVEVQLQNGSWVYLCKAGNEPEDIFSVGVNFSKANKINVDQVEFSRLITFKTLSPGGPPVRGYAYFVTPEILSKEDHTRRLRITIDASDGRSEVITPFMEDPTIRPPELDYGTSFVDLKNIKVLSKFSPLCLP